MTLSFFLTLIYASIPLVGWMINVFALKRRVHWLLLFTMCCIVGYVVLMFNVAAVNAELQRDLARYDLDGDGGFTDQEMTPDAQRAMNAVASDTGRALAPVTGIPITLIWTTINFIILALIDRVSRAVMSLFRRVGHSEADGDPKPPVAVGHSDNPYHPPSKL